MRVVVTSITYEGIIRTNLEFLQALKDYGFDVYLVSPPSNNNMEQEGEWKFVPVNIEPHGTNPLQDYQLFRQYVKIYKEIKPDLVVSMTIKPDVYSGLACRVLHLNYMGVVNGVGDSIYNRGILSEFVLFLLRLGFKRSEWVFFQNNDNRDLFLSKRVVKSGRSSVVPGSGINLSEHVYEEYPDDKDGIQFTYIGRITKDKGISELVGAAEVIHQRHPNVVINIIGACTDAFVDVVQDAHSKHLINYIGTVPYKEIHDIVKKSHAVILPSYHEGIPNVLLEGGAAGRPIIATFAEGCKETFDDGVSGIGFEVKNKDAIVEAIEKFLSMSNAERRQMGIEAHKKISKEFDRKLVVNSYMTIIEKWRMK